MKVLRNISRVQIGRLQEMAIPAAFLGWLFCLLLPYAYMESWKERTKFIDDGGALTFQVVGLGLFFASVLFFNPLKIVKKSIHELSRDHAKLIMVIFFVVQGILSVISISPLESFLYACTTLMIFICFVSLGGKILAARKVLIFGGYSLSIYLILLVGLYGVPEFGTTVGAIQPNQYAKAAIVAMTLSFLGNCRAKLVIFLFAVGCSVVTTSRGGLMFLVVFAIVYILLKAKAVRIVRYYALALVGIVLLVLVDIAGDNFISSFVYNDVLLLSSAESGFGSGFHGRVSYWEAGWDLFSESPLVGYGYRTREDIALKAGEALDAHQGYINLLLDTGILGFALFSISVMLTYFKVIKCSFRQGDHITSTIGAYMTGVFLVIFFDPLYLNLGIPFTIIFILCMATPISGLKMAYSKCKEKTNKKNILRTHNVVISRN